MSGKVYVMSDIHGQKEEMDKMLKKIGFTEEDKLYIIGDVVDRGPQNIEILEYIMGQDNITLLKGNHEDFMLRHMRLLREERGSNTELMYRRLWFINGGDVTFRQLEGISEERKEKIEEFLESLDVEKEIEVEGVKYHLIHGDLGETEEDKIWGRVNEEAPGKEGVTVVFGHTPTIKYTGADGLRAGTMTVWQREDGAYIGIDCGLAGKDHPEIPVDISDLSCICLTTKQVYYNKKQDERLV